ncbi:hypothetical protein EFA69_08655 [Rufibacter immobilis]|uniref:Uncharacterized protein n=1 Tax=Rufibacter immobilis TaxID=1348778 RepID=A0A3M9MXY3_9BACT|nr:hypothetical protein [Rufibacter immobilis]RNI29618.1 hypothetical protein EFA69_08655 [Rufibacter immobilis]
MRKTYFVVLLAALASCQSSTQEETAATSSASAGQEKGQPALGQPRQIQHIVQRTHLFSSPQSPDYFRLVLRGDSITQGQVHFTITTQDGRLIHEEHFPAADLEASLVYEMEGSTVTQEQRAAYILKRMEEFVEPKDFISPAIAPNTPAQTSFVSETAWKKIQANHKAVGFKYLLGKEDGRLLVYDPEQKKAVRYGSFGG